MSKPEDWNFVVEGYGVIAGSPGCRCGVRPPAPGSARQFQTICVRCEDLFGGKLMVLELDRPVESRAMLEDFFVSVGKDPLTATLLASDVFTGAKRAKEA